MTKISLIKSDITKLAVDAIVNAANTSLSAGGGVCGAIHHAAGDGLQKECSTLNGCKTGDAKLTKGYKLPAKNVIHAVGPVWHGERDHEEELLYDAYYNSLQLAMANKIETIAFPDISTGIYGFPKQLAAETAIKAITDFSKTYPEALTEIIFVCLDDENYNIYKKLLS